MSAGMLSVEVNGERQEMPDGATLADLLDRMRTPASGVAVAMDGAVVPRASWSRTPLRTGAVIEVFTAVQGG